VISHPVEVMHTIAVVIPAFGRSHQLARAVDSVLSQSYPNFVLILVNDASSKDLTSVKCRVESSGHLWIERERNGGPAVARNDGASAVESEWIAFLDSDDEWFPEKLELQMQWHCENPDFRISQVHEEWCRNGEKMKKPKYWEQRGGELFAESVERCAIGPSCVMMRRDLWNESGGFDERYRVCEDYELWLRITRREEVGLVPGDTLIRKHGGHTDQLSTSVPALDRYRIAALIELLAGGILSEEQARMVKHGIRSKSAILAAGAEKRGVDERAAYYHELACGDLTGLSAAYASVGGDPFEFADWAD